MLPFLGRTQESSVTMLSFSLLGTVQAGKLTGVDQFLLAPAVDGLVTDAQIGSDLGDGAASGHQSSTLRRNSPG